MNSIVLSTYSYTVSDFSQRLLSQMASKDADFQRKSEKTRWDILSAALEYVWDNSFHNLTVADLMEMTEHSRPVFYQYFDDLYGVMRTLLAMLRDNILSGASAWLSGEDDSVEGLAAALEGMVRECYELGPVLRAIVDAAAGDALLADEYDTFMQVFDDRAIQRVEHLQKIGLIDDFDARPVVVALNRMDSAHMVHAFGRRPRAAVEPVIESSIRIWCATIYGTVPERPPAQNSASG